jgi:hypothetical protein
LKSSGELFRKEDNTLNAMINVKKHAKKLAKFSRTEGWNNYNYKATDCSHEDWRGVVLPARLSSGKKGEYSTVSADVTLQELYGFMFFWERFAIETLGDDQYWDVLHDLFAKTPTVSGKTQHRHHLFSQSSKKNAVASIFLTKKTTVDGHSQRKNTLQSQTAKSQRGPYSSSCTMQFQFLTFLLASESYFNSGKLIEQK